MSGKEIDDFQKILNVRIHVERVIGRIRKFWILQSTIPILQVHLLDNVMSVIAALVNINNTSEFSWILFPINWNLYFVEWSFCFISFSTLFYKNQDILIQPGVLLFFDILSLNLFLFCSCFLPWFSDFPKPLISILQKDVGQSFETFAIVVAVFFHQKSAFKLFTYLKKLFLIISASALFLFYSAFLLNFSHIVLINLFL